MSKHRHRDRYNDSRNMNSKQGYGPINNNPFGISPQQLLSLLGSNFNMNGIGNILSNMNMDGFDFNSIANQMGSNNPGNLGNMNNNMNNNMGNMNPMNHESVFNMQYNENKKENYDIEKEESKEVNDTLDKLNVEGSTESVGNESNISNINSEIKSDYIEIDSSEKDENLQFLLNIKRSVDPRKTEFINRIINAYKDGVFK